MRCLWNAFPDIIHDKLAVLFFKKGTKVEFPNTYVIIFYIGCFGTGHLGRSER